MYEHKKVVAFKLIPYTCSFATSKSYGTQSRALGALDKSSNIALIQKHFTIFNKSYPNMTWTVIFSVYKCKLR